MMPVALWTKITHDHGDDICHLEFYGYFYTQYMDITDHRLT